MKTSLEQADLRVRRTHKLLWEALMAELSERAFEEITVTDICERAMVHRTTFYKHYADKYALLEQGADVVWGRHWPVSEAGQGVYRRSGFGQMHEWTPANQHFAFPPAMQVQFFAGAVLSLLAWWLEQDMPLSPHHMAQYLLSFHSTLPSHS